MEQLNKTTFIGGIILLILTIGLLFYASKVSGGPSKYDGFAQCLGQKGATFYGAFWCPHCQKQKALFGKSKQYLPYVECSTPDSRGQTPICIERKITTYPTWYFGDTSSSTGEISLSVLAEKTGCVLPTETVK
ncbi:MAG: hypothetical protein EXS46_02160 [Candidatus Taylorbacteria bacterium]|nr:hypothetical protein [Candidatus Taylorbacteria bacterium]